MDDLLKKLEGAVGQSGTGGASNVSNTGSGGLGDLLGEGGLGNILGGALGGGVGGSLGGGLGGMLGGGLGAMLPALLPALLGMLGGQSAGGQSAGGQSAGGQSGAQTGMHQLVANMQARGMGGLADSWVGSGANQSISPSQVEEALGPDKLQQLSAESGLPTEQVSQGLAAILPEVVNHLTPDGQVPNADAVSQLVGGLLNRSGAQ